MSIIEKAITGSEQIAAETVNPSSALIEFYRAFNTGNLELMAKNWQNNDEVSMSNPLGGIRRGWNSIKEVYDRIFNGDAKVYVEFYNYSIHESDTMFCAVGNERGFFQLADTKIELAIRTSRIYRLSNGNWNQLHHHGSIDNPELLKKYQQAVLGKKNT